MVKTKYRVLHITPDDKFFDGVFALWERLDAFDNEALLITDDSNYSVQYIKNTSKLQILSNRVDVSNRLGQDDYHVLYFHSLSPQLFKYFKYIPKDKVVIWWAWGFDLYYENISPQPFINLNLYKPVTSSFLKQKSVTKRLYFSVRMIVKNLLVKHYQSKVIDRIDYFQPVTKKEYYLMKSVRKFRAMEFYYDGSLNIKMKMKSKSSDGNILLGNSATPTNNHIDVLQHVINNRKQNQQIIMPLNYGGNNDYLEWLKENIRDVDNVRLLLDFLPLYEYYQILDSCSYAIFGVIRQQAMGNIRYALCNGMKIFLYKDSIPYKSLREMGFVVYAIEDINKDNLQTPLTLSEIETNRLALNNEILRRSCLYKDFLYNLEKNS